MTYHILVVDDEPDIDALITQRFRRKIRSNDYRFTFACNGAEAYKSVVETASVDMVLTDINMPVMDGLTLIRQLSTLSHPPKIVVVSAYSDMANIRAAMNSGAFDFVTKPINFQDLSITLEKTLSAVEREKTNQAQLERAKIQLVHSEKMSSLGQMVAGVAHEINNPVNFIYGNLRPAKLYVEDLVELVKCYQHCYPDPVPEVKDCLEEIDIDFLQEDIVQLFDSLSVGTNRIRDIVLSLRNFSRLDEAGRKVVDIHEGIESTLVVLNNRLTDLPNRPAIEIKRKYSSLPKIDCYPGQLNQAVMNIVNNAIDAFEAASENCSAGEIDALNEIRIETSVVDERWVRIAIADNGPGMDENTVAKLFDPFFTTKPVGKGTGLGLSISYQIVTENHGGRLFCQSALGEGTQLTIEIPFTTL